ncbi:MAG: mechanosensitive ion channel family protein [Acetatifactor sp.]|nr:mechanosensitive ion channel family protein [Acetatifactor sp.]
MKEKAKGNKEKIKKAIKKATKDTAAVTKRNIKHLVKTAIVFVMVLVVTNPAMLAFLPKSMRETINDTWSSLFGGPGALTGMFKINWIGIFQLIIVILFLVLVRDIIQLILGKLSPKTKRAKSLHSMANSYLNYAIGLVGIFWCLSIVGVNLSTIFASIGIVALVVGFAAESLIEDVITGLFLAFENEFNVGDIIEYDGFRGTVTSIGVRVTCIKSVGGNVKIVNNSDLRNVLNRSMASSVAICDVPISYGADLKKTEEILNGIISAIPEKYPDVFSKAPEYVGVQELADSSVDLRITAEVSEGDIYKATRIINREVKLGFDEAGVEIPFKQLVVHQGK